MPRMNGYEAARRIREQRWGSGMILVAPHRLGPGRGQAQGNRKGFDLHFTKPVSAADFERLAGWIAGRRVYFPLT